MSAFMVCAIQSNMSCLISKVQNNNNQAYQHQIDSAQERAWENVPKQLMRDLAPERPWVCFSLCETSLFAKHESSFELLELEYSSSIELEAIYRLISDRNIIPNKLAYYI